MSEPAYPPSFFNGREFLLETAAKPPVDHEQAAAQLLEIVERNPDVLEKLLWDMVRAMGDGVPGAMRAQEIVDRAKSQLARLD